MTRDAKWVVQAAVAALLVTGCSSAGDGQDKPRPRQALDKQALNTELRAALFNDRGWLIDVIADPQMRQSVCIPPPNDSYELFQAAVRDNLEVLWDLDANSSSYRLSKAQHEAVLDCAKLLDEYDENFEAWKKLMKGGKRT